jgi:hypothetical protein
VRFHVADTLTGRIVGRLEPSQWEVTDPLRSPGLGSLTVPLPTGTEALARLVDLTLPRRRWVAVEDDQGRFLFGGPIPRRPARHGGEITIPLVDWRSWFYRAPIRPNADGSRRNYIRTGAAAKDQGAMMGDLFALALDTVGAPYMVIDTPPVTDVKRELTALMLDRSIGEYLDSVANRERGAEWYTYVTRSVSDPLQLVPHCAVAYPERASRSTPIRVEYRQGKGGNAHDYTWPEGAEAPTRVWAVGDGEPPDQALAMDETVDLTTGVDVCWEETVGPLDGVSKNATAYEYAFAVLAHSQGLSGTAEFAITDAAIPFGDYHVGDRARVILDDLYDAADVPAARIVSRTLTGGRGVPLSARISVDLANADYGDSSTVPGEAVTDA